MNRAFRFLLFSSLSWATIVAPQAALAAEWTTVTENAAGDQFLVDTSAIQEQGSTRFYWEFRQFVEPNNAFIEVALDAPLQGAVVRWAVNCSDKTQRLLRINAYADQRQLIQKFTYGDTGVSVQSRPGSSTYKVGEFVCNAKL